MTADEAEIDHKYNEIVRDDPDEWKTQTLKQKIKDLRIGVGLQKLSKDDAKAYIMRKEAIVPDDFIRVRSTEFGIAGTPRIDGGDEMESMEAQALRMFNWYEDKHERQKYTAPCVPLIQSSGTGKTKLFYDFRHSNKSTIQEYTRIFISCLKKDTRPYPSLQESVYDVYLDFQDRSPTSTYFGDQLNMLVGTDDDDEDGKNKIVLLLDEAQVLTTDGGQHMMTLRKFLTKKRGRKQVIAFFAGTTTGLANCYPTPEQRNHNSSREGERIDDYYDSGQSSYDPMYMLFSMGVFRDRIKFTEGATEFERAIPFGRPLFARLLLQDNKINQGNKVMATQSIMDKDMAIIAMRMLLGRDKLFKDDPTETILPYASIWATRVQLGSVHAPVIDQLVAKAYAHLTRFRVSSAGGKSPPSLSAGFMQLPDPVCARLAMCMMDEKWELKTGKQCFVGASKHEWVKKLKKLLSSGLFCPSRGDLGELLSAAYLLLCGDVLRNEKDNMYHTFSVPVSSWVNMLIDPREVKAMAVDSPCCINFIQFCRNDLCFGLADTCNESFLEYLYNSCCAVYAHEGCQFYDAYAAIKRTKDGVDSYSPLIMSIKTQHRYTEGAAKKDVDKIVWELKQIKQSCGLVLIILLDRDDGAEKKNQHAVKNVSESSGNQDVASTQEMLIDIEDGTTYGSSKKRCNQSKQRSLTVSTASDQLPVDECMSNIVSRIISIPSNDPFGITDLVRSLTGYWEESGIFASHSFVGVMPAAGLTGCRATGRGNTDAILLKQVQKTTTQTRLANLWEKRKSDSVSNSVICDASEPMHVQMKE